MSKPIILRHVDRAAWRAYLENCHEASVDDPEALLEVFFQNNDLIRSALAIKKSRDASEKSRLVELRERQN